MVEPLSFADLTIGNFQKQDVREGDKQRKQQLLQSLVKM